MTFWILGVLAGFLTLLATKRYTFVYYAAASLAWFALWGYNVNFPPANITVGTFVYDVLYYTLIFVAIGVFLLYFVGRSRRNTSTTLGLNEEGNLTVNSSSQTTFGGNDEYRQRMRRAYRGRRAK